MGQTEDEISKYEADAAELRKRIEALEKGEYVFGSSDDRTIPKDIAPAIRDDKHQLEQLEILIAHLKEIKKVIRT